MNSYQKAADSLKEAVKASLDQDVDPNLQSEIWRHYQGMQNIANQLKEKDTFAISGEGLYDPDYNINFVAAAQGVDTISFSTYGNDVITFS